MSRVEVLAQARRDATRMANAPKEELMRCQSRMEAIGLLREAESLGRIIFRLEAWQHRTDR